MNASRFFDEVKFLFEFNARSESDNLNDPFLETYECPVQPGNFHLGHVAPSTKTRLNNVQRSSAQQMLRYL